MQRSSPGATIITPSSRTTIISGKCDIRILLSTLFSHAYVLKNMLQSLSIDLTMQFNIKFNYFVLLTFTRCFPPEKEARSIHRVIDFVHSKVKNALELISREEKNKSLQSFFKELNDHSTNAFEFGKQFLAFLLHSGTYIFILCFV